MQISLLKSVLKFTAKTEQHWRWLCAQGRLGMGEANRSDIPSALGRRVTAQVDRARATVGNQKCSWRLSIGSGWTARGEFETTGDCNWASQWLLETVLVLLAEGSGKDPLSRIAEWSRCPPWQQLPSEGTPPHTQPFLFFSYNDVFTTNRNEDWPVLPSVCLPSCLEHHTVLSCCPVLGSSLLAVLRLCFW